MERIKLNIACLSLAFKILDEGSLIALDAAKLPPHKSSIHLLRERLGRDVCELAIIEKCNAVLLLAVHGQEVSHTHVCQRLLSVWDSTSKGGISNMVGRIKILRDSEAIKYLGETAVGIHSLVIGDSQVYSQVRYGLSESFHQQKDAVVLPALYSWLENIAAVVRENTDLNKGNISIERLSTELVKEHHRQQTHVGIIGLGSSGKLVTKILSEELCLPLYISNRTVAVSMELVAKYGCKLVPFGDFSFLRDSSVVVLALSPSPETAVFASRLLESIPSETKMPMLIIDLASPPLCNWEDMLPDDITLITLAELSARANQVIEARRRSINRTRQIISNAVSDAESMIETKVAQASYRQQKERVILKEIPQQVQLFVERSTVFRAIRQHLEKLGFVEIITPYIVGVSTDPPKVDSGSALTISWPGGAFLRQSDQLYKQMVVVSGMPKVFEIGPFWRAEATPSHRHLDETIGLDVELSRPQNLRSIQSLAYSVIKEAYKAFTDVCPEAFSRLMLPDFEKLPILNYGRAIEWLRESNFPISFGEDLGILGDARIGWLTKKRIGSDAIIVERYPDTIKKFYNRKCSDGTTETFDLILMGWELASGAIRETNREKIELSMRLARIEPRMYEFYLSIVENAPCHGGFGMGLDRLIAKFLGTDDIRDAVPFPRTFETLIP